MRHTAFYLIDPRPALRERLQLLKDRDLEGILLDPFMLSHEEGGKSFWFPEDREHTMKILFLAQLKEYTPLLSDADFETVFDSPRLNADVFDCWWTIRRLGVDETAESLYPMLRQFYHLVDRTDNDRVNQWLEWVRAGKGGDKKD